MRLLQFLRARNGAFKTSFTPFLWFSLVNTFQLLIKINFIGSLMRAKMPQKKDYEDTWDKSEPASLACVTMLRESEAVLTLGAQH